jgi:hypothetical protein
MLSHRILGAANPIGSKFLFATDAYLNLLLMLIGAIGQLISPLVGDVRQSVCTLSVIFRPKKFLKSACSHSDSRLGNHLHCCCPIRLLRGLCTSHSTQYALYARPQTVDSLRVSSAYAGAQREPSLDAFIRAWLGLSDHPQEARMSVRERVDFAIILSCFGALVGASNTFALLTAQYVVRLIVSWAKRRGNTGRNAHDMCLIGTRRLFIRHSRFPWCNTPAHRDRHRNPFRTTFRPCAHASTCAYL